VARAALDRLTADPQLPMVESQPLVFVERDGVSYTLLGTAHVSKLSAQTAIAMASEAQFDAIAVELCPSRAQAMRDPNAWRRIDLFEVFRSGKTGMVMASLALGGYQRRIAEQFGIEPGAEMKGAMEQAERDGKSLFLIDREVGITLKRVYSAVGFWQRAMIASGLLASLLSRETISEDEIEKLKEGDMLESTFSEFAERSPQLFVPLISERDEFMALNLRTQSAQSGARHVLAVVGAGHLKGLTESLKNGGGDAQLRLLELNEIPKPSWLANLLPWAVLVFVVGGIALGFYQSPDLGWGLVVKWVVTTGVFSALGTLIAFGHPLTILAALLGAPLTTLHPGIGIGMLTGLVELWARKPSIDELERLRDDVLSVKGWWRNRVARAFLVFVLSSLGAMLGMYVAGFQIFRALT